MAATRGRPKFRDPGGSQKEYFDDSGVTEMPRIQPTPDVPGTIFATGQSSTRSDTGDGVKIATPELILLDNESIPIEQMASVIFENIGGHELISVVRNDLVNGQNTAYSIVSNLKTIQSQNNSENIVFVPGNAQKYFSNYQILFENHVPEYGTGPNKEIVYVDQETGNIIINVINLSENEQVEIQVIASGETFDDTYFENITV
jgi:hypothetical protein